LEHPAFAPDTQAIAEMKLKRLLPTSGEPGKLGAGILGGILGGGQQSGNKNQQNNTQGIVKGLLDQFGKKKK
jgi:hypothetical protein